ncbi:RING-type zinc finger protein [Nosema bombycis CQ1]|uniref:RING-type zinc finger protein n=1 Tax=Nosema bombycis (strain CQ1 / CVCC 102059) TaxID=578461 RepID=R0MMG3_NOSB1|nr:RING-type zinc finger protein [Nosema bombycis CQ1]|eukprot:EOB15375.1 RING-type zinc finger protein [Nosema bombycis CQ1]
MHFIYKSFLCILSIIIFFFHAFMHNPCKVCFWPALEENGICDLCQQEINEYSIPQNLLDLFVLDTSHVCCICYDKISSNSLSDCTTCSTKYHSSCLNQWRVQSKRCAVCRERDLK